jgi:ABC-2 type transport system ATP-binding protein
VPGTEDEEMAMGAVTGRPGLAISTEGLGRRYGKSWALQDCSVRVPRGRISALVGPNGAGKSTLLHLLTGLRAPSTGQALIFGRAPEQSPALLAMVGFVAQEVPLYSWLSIKDHGDSMARLNTTWDDKLFASRAARLGVPLSRRCGSLSGGQKAQIALALALAKRPRLLLLLDEPVSALDPLARREFFASLSEAVAETAMTVMLSSHLLADLERVCDHLVLLARGRAQLCGDLAEVTASHTVLTGPADKAGTIARDHHMIAAEQFGRRVKLVVQLAAPVTDPVWDLQPASAEDIVLAYMAASDTPAMQAFDLAGSR